MANRRSFVGPPKRRPLRVAESVGPALVVVDLGKYERVDRSAEAEQNQDRKRHRSRGQESTADSLDARAHVESGDQEPDCPNEPGGTVFFQILWTTSGSVMGDTYTIA